MSKARIYLGRTLAAEVEIDPSGVVTIPAWLHNACHGADITIHYEVKLVGCWRERPRGPAQWVHEQRMKRRAR